MPPPLSADLWLGLHDCVAADDLNGPVAQHILKVVKQLLGLIGGREMKWRGQGEEGVQHTTRIDTSACTAYCVVWSRQRPYIECTEPLNPTVRQYARDQLLCTAIQAL